MALLLVAATLMASHDRQWIGQWHAETKTMIATELRRAAATALGSGLSSAGAIAPRLPPPPPTVIGMNVAGISYFEPSMPFANLMVGSEWLGVGWHHFPADRLGKDGSVLSLPTGTEAQIFVPVPPSDASGIEIRCSWSGSGKIRLQGFGQTLASSDASLRFHVVNQDSSPERPWLALADVDPSRPFRNLDCRPIGLAATVRFRPEFLHTLRGYGVLRFMDWQNANANLPATWASRHVASDLPVDGSGVAIEHMMALTRALGSDPWFVMPWNADDDYLRHFAQLVAATLPRGRHVYVETGNEVWNAAFPVAHQALKEGVERKLSTDEFTAQMRRYAQRTGEVMRIWEAAFAGRSGLVRVLSSQHVRPESAQIALSFGDTARHVDALATAPYFGITLGGTQNTREDILLKLSAALTSALDDAVANRRVARSFGKRYIAYEGGESLVLWAQKALLIQLQHDPAQYDLYQRFLAGWRLRIGDVLCLYNSSGEGWGLTQWEDETPAQAPKLRAVRNVIPEPAP